MTTNVSTELLRTFVAVVDCGSMVRAGEQICLTQSAISLQIGRLEELLHQDLFRRSGRKLSLTSAGAKLIVSARQILLMNDALVEEMARDDLSTPIQIGVVQDFAETVLPVALGYFAKGASSPLMLVRVGGSVDLLQAMWSGELDLVMAVGQENDPAAIHTTRMLWLGKAHLAECDVIPLVVLAEPCIYRERSLRALDDSGRRYRIVFETPHLSGLRAAVEAGLGITCRTDLMVNHDTIEALPEGLLPRLPNVAYTLQIMREPDAVVALLMERLKQASRQIGWGREVLAA